MLGDRHRAEPLARSRRRATRPGSRSRSARCSSCIVAGLRARRRLAERALPRRRAPRCRRCSCRGSSSRRSSTRSTTSPASTSTRLVDSAPLGELPHAARSRRCATPLFYGEAPGAGDTVYLGRRGRRRARARRVRLQPRRTTGSRPKSDDGAALEAGPSRPRVGGQALRASPARRRRAATGRSSGSPKRGFRPPPGAQARERRRSPRDSPSIEPPDRRAALGVRVEQQPRPVRRRDRARDEVRDGDRVVGRRAAPPAPRARRPVSASSAAVRRRRRAAARRSAAAPRRRASSGVDPTSANQKRNSSTRSNASR